MSRTPFRVAFLTPKHFGPYIGGGERYPLNLARGLIAADSDVHVDIVAPGPVVGSVVAGPRLNLCTVPVAVEGESDLDHIAPEIWEPIERCDVVHVHQAFTRASQFAILIAKLLGKRLVVTDHGAVSNHIEHDVHYLDLVDLFVFQSQFARGRLEANRPHVVLPGGVDHRFFCPGPSPSQRSHVLFVGRLLPHKGVDRLLAALPPEVPCVIAGRPYDPDYTAYVHALGRGRTISFVENADDLALRRLYRDAIATVLPSVHRDAWGRVYEAPELMGFTALESMACGTPAIVSPAGALAEFVRHGETGFVFDSLTHLTTLIGELAGGDADAERMGTAARRRVEREYAVDVVGTHLLAAYREIG
ncbi:MAG: glycosyltransferase family 4 protein [Solirubrobacteraceae bacterium]